MPRKGWPLAPAFGGSGLDGAWRSAEVCHQEIDGEVWPPAISNRWFSANFGPLLTAGHDLVSSRRMTRC